MKTSTNLGQSVTFALLLALTSLGVIVLMSIASNQM